MYVPIWFLRPHLVPFGSVPIWFPETYEYGDIITDPTQISGRVKHIIYNPDGSSREQVNTYQIVDAYVVGYGGEINE